MTIDAYASLPQYLHHVLPVWRALNPAARGTLYQGDDKPLPREVPILVAASGDMARAGRERVALMEHGAGLSYGGDLTSRGLVARESPSYAGGADRRAELFLHPGWHPAARDRARYPNAMVEVVGCPRLDELPAKQTGGEVVVAISFHWDTHISPESRSAFIFYREHVRRLAADARATGEFRLIGHGHPRSFERYRAWYERVGIEPVESFGEVCRRADIYVVDNSSTLYEFASTGRQVVALNAPFYRKYVHHGARFWEAVPGPQVDEPSTLGDVIRREIDRPGAWDERREAALDYVYEYRTGAAERAAAVLEGWM